MASPLKYFKSKLGKFESSFPKIYAAFDLLFNIALIIVLVLVIRTYMISPFQVYGPSMCNTLNHIDGECKHRFGEYLIVNRGIYYPFFNEYRYRAPVRGDIVVFRPPENAEEYYIKRVVGLPGETVKIQNGKVYIINKEHPTQWELPEPYLNEKNAGRTYPLIASKTTEYKVPEGEFFVMGDNRSESTDSRQCFVTVSTEKCASEGAHFITQKAIEGKASLVLWPFNKIRILENPDYEALAQTAATATK